MRRSFVIYPVIGMFLLKLASGADLESSDEATPFNFGDLTVFDQIVEEEERGDATDYPDYLYRAQGASQLADHSQRRVQIVVHKSMEERGYQYLTVAVDGETVLDVPASTAWERTAKAATRTYQSFTPVGKFLPDGIQPRRFSNTWQVWLQFVIRFSGGIWIHATTPDHFAEIGSPASGGCVRLHTSDAKRVYDIVAEYGMNETAITVLPAKANEKQVPWKHQATRKAPPALQEWRLQNKVMAL